LPVDPKRSFPVAFTQIPWQGAWENETREAHAPISRRTEGKTNEEF